MELSNITAVEIPYLQLSNKYPTLTEVSIALDKHGVKIPIDLVNWKTFTYRPEVSLHIAFTTDEILLKYHVLEKYISARHIKSNSPVHEDSCVEFFISSGNGSYYNFEFNCIGTASVGYGQQRIGRVDLDIENISRIRTSSTLGEKQIASREIDGSWELTVTIPFSIFKEEAFRRPSENQFTANFYKCGDMLPLPHFLSWNPIHTKEPDFHRPEYFEKLRFIRP